MSATRRIAAEPHAVFDLLADPVQHAVLDGSGMVRGSLANNPARLRLNSRFSMDMKLWGTVPYRITNRVVEFEANRAIAWCHFGGHRWRWAIEPCDGGSRVTATFDWSTARSPKAIELLGYPERNRQALEATLERLARHFDGANAT